MNLKRTVYKPREDSFLLKEVVEQLDISGKKALDMGTGSGIQALTLVKNGADVEATDINSKALSEAEKRAEEQNFNIKFIESDLFENISGKYDLVVFNPPYLQGGNEFEDGVTWRGGKKGTETIERFLNHVDDYLNPSGEVLIVLSDLVDNSPILENFEVETVREKKLWFETLRIVRYTR